MQGRHFAVQGDSISGDFSGWQDVVIARTGMSLVQQDARPGRRYDTAFECYGTTTPGTALGTFELANNPNNCRSLNSPDGSTLAQIMAPVDLLVIEMGTNDTTVSLGELADATTARTFYGNMRWVVETYLKAKPTLRIVLVTVQFNGFASAATAQQYAAAQVAYGHSIGVPVINMFELGGVNAITAPVLLRDGTHPSDFGFANFYGPVIAQGLQRLF